jgi:glycerate kinase
VANIEGAGAAGGLGAGAICFLNANIKSGIDFVMDQTKFKQHLNSKIDLIITGEGSVDKQTLEGKVIKGISIFATQNNIPFSIISGVIKDKELVQENLKPSSINAIMDLNVTLENAIQNATKHVTHLAYNLIKQVKDHQKT